MAFRLLSMSAAQSSTSGVDYTVVGTCVPVAHISDLQVLVPVPRLQPHCSVLVHAESVHSELPNAPLLQSSPAVPQSFGTVTAQVAVAAPWLLL